MLNNALGRFWKRLLAHPYLTVCSSLLLLASLALQRPGPLLLLIVGMLVFYLPLKGDVFGSLAGRAVIALTIVAGLFQVEALLFWTLDFWASPLIYILVTFAIVVFWLLKANTKLQKTLTVRPFFDVAILVPCLIVGGLQIAKIALPQEPTAASIVRSVNYGMDDITHAGMFSDVLRNNSNLLAGPERKDLISRPLHASYPMGWHITASIVTGSFMQHKERTVLQNVTIYFYAKLATLLYAVAAAGLLFNALLRKLYDATKPGMSFTVTVIATLYLAFIALLQPFYEGFFSFLPVLAFTALFTALVADNTSSTTKLIILGLIAAASSATWLLTGPVLVVALALHCLSSVPTLRSLPLQVYPILGLGAGAFLIQAYILLQADKNVTTHLVNSGGITTPDHLLLFVCLAGFLALFVAKNKVWNDLGRRLNNVVLSCGALLALVLIYTSTEADEIRYYYLKIQAVLLVILTTLLVALIATITLEVARREKNKIRSYTSLAMMPILLCLLIPGVIGYNYARNTVGRSMTFALSPNDATVLLKALDTTVSDNNERLYFVLPDQAGRTALSTNTAQLTHRMNGCDAAMFGALNWHKFAEFGAKAAACAETLPPIKIYANQLGGEELRRHIPQNLIANREIDLIEIN